MLEPATPANEDARLDALRAMNLLDTPPEDYLDRIVNIAAQMFGVPIVLISLVDQKRQWFKARHGLEVCETPRKISFCGHAILEQDTFCVPDARLDPRFADNPLVTGTPHIRFYAGKRICAPGGEAIGTLCLIDTKSRQLSDADRILLDALAKCIEQMLALRQSLSAAASGKNLWATVLMTTLAAGLFEVFSSQLFFIPNPPTVLIAMVVFAAYHAGIRAGLISAVIATLYFAHFFAIPGQPFHYTADNLMRVLVWAVATPAIAVMVGILQRRSARLFQREKVYGILTTHLADRAASVGELRRLNDQIRMVTDNAPTHIAYYDEHWQCRYSNAPYAQWFGLDVEQIVGKTPREITGAAMFAELEPFLRRVDAGEKVEYQATRKSADGRLRVIDVTLTPHFDDDRRTIGCYAFFNDITKIAEAEDALRKKSDELQMIIETMAQGLVMFDSEGRYVLMNPAAERLTGVSREKVLGLRIDQAPWKRIRSDNTEIAMGDLPFERHRRGEDCIEGFELDFVLPDGRRISLLNSSVALRDAEGRFLGAVTTYFDVTARKAAETALERKSVELTDLIETMAEGVSMFDRDGRYLLFNAAAERIFGAPREQVMGKNINEVPWKREHADGTAISAEETSLERLRRGEERVIGREIDILLPNGRRHSLELNSVARRDAEGRFAGMISTFSDVTARKRAEVTARRSQERLARALDASGLALFDIDVATGNVYLSEGWAQIIGSEPGETHTTVGALLELMHPDERETMWKIAMEAMSGKRASYEVEHRVRRRDGQWVWILSRSRVVEHDATGRSVRMAGTNVDITERKHNEQRLHYLATRDTLTDLMNRARFGDLLGNAVEQASRQSGRVALISVNLDRFTMINDSLGLHVGDAVLKCVAGRLAAALSGENTVARPGGDEFLVLMPHIRSHHEAAATAELVLAAIIQPIAVGGHELVVTASIGIALYPDDGDSAGLLLRNADIALHNAKSAGGDNVKFFAEQMNLDVRGRLETEAAMRQGLVRGEFVVYYQPQIDLASGALVGFEALVRWQHPERGLVPPGDFIPIAESTGLIVALGEWVLNTACNQAVRWQRPGGPPTRMAVNVTARQFRQKGFVRTVKSALGSSGLDPRLLELEIIENAIMDHGTDTTATLDAIRNMGVQLAIDDFGTGYSSLSYLKRLPIDTVKIDQSFVVDLPGDPDAGAIVRAIIALAHNLGLKVLAEGVETRAQFEYLRGQGCDQAQGYFFGRPQPPELLPVGKNGNVVVPFRNGTA